MHTPVNELYQNLRHALDSLRRRALLLLLATTAARVLGTCALLCALWFLVESAFQLEPAARTGAGVLVLIALGAGLAHDLRGRLGSYLSLRRFALRVEHAYPDLAARLISALELWEDPDRRSLYSPDLLAATVSGAAAAMQALDRSRLLVTAPLRRGALRLVLLWTALAIALAGSDEFARAAWRCAHPLTHFAYVAETTVVVSPAVQEIVRGEDAVAHVAFGGRLPRSAQVHRRDDPDAEWLEEEIVVAGRDSLAYAFAAVRRPFEFQVLANDGASRLCTVRVVDPPTVQRLRVTYHYPEYSGLGARVEEDSGDIRALAGTRLVFDIAASKTLAAAALVVGDSVRVPARLDGTDATASITVDTSSYYHVELTDARGLHNPDPIRYSIEAVPDAAPQVTVSSPGRDADMPENMQVLIAAAATDDYQVSRAELVHRVNDGPEQVLPMSLTPGPEVSLAYVWDLSDVNLLPEDRVYYHVVAYDNDEIAGPKSGTSRTFVLRFPSLYELYEESRQASEENLDELEELSEEGHDLGEYIEQVRRELLKDEEMSWEARRELESTIERQTDRAEAVEELAAELQQTLEQLESNGLTSEDLLDRIAQVRELMDEVMSPELREALAELQEAMEQGDPEQLAEALRQFNQDQQAFQERLDRTIELLERIRAEQRLEAAVSQADELHERQEQINRELDAGADGDRLPNQEEALARDTERLSGELGDLSQTMQGIDPETGADLFEQAAAMEQGDLTGHMQQMIQHMRAQASPQARRAGAGLEQDLGELAANMHQLQQEFTARQKRLLSDELRQSMYDLLTLSEQQEDLLDPDGVRNDADLAADASLQYAIMQGVAQIAEQLGAVSRKTLAVEHPLTPTIGQALRSMQEAADDLGQLDARAASRPQLEAMRSVNEAVLLLRQSLENVAQSKAPSSFGEAMQKMLGLSEQQAQLNQATQQALSQAQRAGRSGTMEQAGRLAAQQRRIYEALEELRRATRGHRGAQQRSEAIEAEMREVLGDLEQRRLSQRTVEGQKHILQRMLDASRSIHTQGYDEERRRSETGEDQRYAGPSWLPDDMGQSFDALRQAMNEALEGEYPAEYRAVIQRYFEQLVQDAQQDAEAATP